MSETELLQVEGQLGGLFGCMSVFVWRLGLTLVIWVVVVVLMVSEVMVCALKSIPESLSATASVVDCKMGAKWNDQKQTRGQGEITRSNELLFPQSPTQSSTNIFLCALPPCVRNQYDTTDFGLDLTLIWCRRGGICKAKWNNLFIWMISNWKCTIALEDNLVKINSCQNQCLTFLWRPSEEPESAKKLFCKCFLWLVARFWQLFASTDLSRHCWIWHQTYSRNTSGENHVKNVDSTFRRISKVTQISSSAGLKGGLKVRTEIWIFKRLASKLIENPFSLVVHDS